MSEIEGEVVSEIDLPPGWTRWHTGEDGVVVLTYRPDVFDGADFPAACLPTITVKPERAGGPRGRPVTSTGPETTWVVELRLEPEVVVERERSPSREKAIDTATQLSGSFVSGNLPLREAYQLPRDDYLERLDELLGEESGRGV